MIRKLLIANRGEIACRIVRTARRMGIATVAVYSDADEGALHVAMADEAVRIGEAAPSQSYLNVSAIVEAARKSGADAIHPGYGFLSENAGFARACAGAGLAFVGPSADAIEAMGDKARAKALMEKAGVPVVPGYAGADQSPETLAAEAQRIGYPLLLKAAAGGGGRGMRRVEAAGAIASAVESARREAESAFSDSALLIEKLVEEARHIEIQVFGDTHGKVVHLGERDCSAQRRHQKVIEETPAPGLDAETRAALAADAIKAAEAVGYAGAGTVEFIVGRDGAHHFLEMNTRLQVEHPVTEMITGLDLVEWQLRVAAGEALPLAQEQITFSGHAVEARLYAEDPQTGFAPQTGRVLSWQPGEAAADGVRIDHGLCEGQTITPHYEPMLAKYVAHGPTREAALAKLSAAIERAPVFGIIANRAFLFDLLSSDEFVSGTMTTRLLDTWQAEGAAIFRVKEPPLHAVALAAIIHANPGGDWFRTTGVAQCPITFRCGEDTFETMLRFERGRLAEVTVDGAAVTIGLVDHSETSARYLLDGVEHVARTLRDGRSLWLDLSGRTYRFEEPDPLAGRIAVADPFRITAPTAGLVREMMVTVGDALEEGAPVALIEAMKMETTLRAATDGVVAAVHARAGDQTAAGALLVELRES